MSALYSYNDGYVFEPDNIAQQGDYDLLNASIEYRPMEKFGIELWGRNLTDDGICRPEDHDWHRDHRRTRRAADLWCEPEVRLLREKDADKNRGAGLAAPARPVLHGIRASVHSSPRFFIP